MAALTCQMDENKKSSIRQTVLNVFMEPILKRSFIYFKNVARMTRHFNKRVKMKGVKNKDVKQALGVPARVDPLRANRRRPFFFRIKLAPINTLELTAKERPM